MANPNDPKLTPNVQKPVEQKPQAELKPSQRPHSTEASEVLLRLYLKKRIEGQLQFYDSRVTEFDTDIGFMVSVGAGIMAVSAIVSAIGATSNSAELALITALLPALAALAASLRQLYQWEKQSSLYRDASLGLQETRLLVPDWDQFDPRTAPAIVPSLVRSAEEVFMAEINQWGQIALGLDDQEQDTLNKALRDLAATDSSIEMPPGTAAAAASTASTPTAAPSEASTSPAAPSDASTSDSTSERGSSDFEDGGMG